MAAFARRSSVAAMDLAMEAGDTKFWVLRPRSRHRLARRRLQIRRRLARMAIATIDRVDRGGAPWCDGNVGMVGISAIGAEQSAVAKNNRRTSKRSSV